MPVEEISEGRWRVRLRYGAGLRGRFIITAKSAAAAEAKADRMSKMANELARCGKHAEARAVLEEAGAAVSDADLMEIESVVRELCAEEEGSAPARQAPSGDRTPFREVAELWLSGDLHRRWPDDVPAKSDTSIAQDRGMMALINREIGHIPVGKITLDDAERAKAAVPVGRVTGTRRRYALLIRRVMTLAEYPLRLIERSPVPVKFVPAEGRPRAFGFLYPDEDRQLLGCDKVPFDDRIFYGFVDRNGLRVSEAARMVWGDIDLQRGTVALDRNKTNNPRTWALAPDVIAALAAYRGNATDEDAVFPMFVHHHVARRFRSHLVLAGVNRRDLHATTKERRPLRFHDLRATFITLALAMGKTETWVMDRTGHTTSAQLNRYRRQARHAAELNLGWLGDLDECLNVGQGVGPFETEEPKLAGPLNPSRNRLAPSESSTEPKQAAPEVPHEPAQSGGPAALSQVGQVGQVSPDPLIEIETRLARALDVALASQQWQLAQDIVRELGERRRARTSPDITSLDAARKRRDEGGGK